MNKFVQIGDFILDVVLNESHKFASEITDYPVEDGGTFSDNIRALPIEFSVEGIVTNAPLPSMQATQLKNPIPLISQPTPEDTIGVFRSLVTGAPAPTRAVVKHLRSDQAYAYLRRIWELCQPITVRTSLGVFEKMGVANIEITRDARTGDALKFTASFKQLQVIINERMKSSRTPGYGGKNRRGPKNGDPNVGARVLWRRGIQPGGPVIYDTKYVEMRYDPTSKKTEWWYVKSQPISLAEMNFQTSKVSPGAQANTAVSGFFSLYGKEENRKLTDRETTWLLKDLHRDNRGRQEAAAAAAQDQGASFGSDEDYISKQVDRKAASQARSWASRGTADDPYDPDILRRPIQDPSKMQRSMMQQQGSGSDPLGGVSSKKPLDASRLSNASDSTSNLTSLLP